MSPPNLRSADLREAVARIVRELSVGDCVVVQYHKIYAVSERGSFAIADAILPLIAQAVAEERERCAGVVEAELRKQSAIVKKTKGDSDYASSLTWEFRKISDKIRALGAGEAG
jgi:hypothetical protein